MTDLLIETPAKSELSRSGKQEFNIDIHIKDIKLKVTTHTEVRIFWQVDKKKIKTPVATLNKDVDNFTFDIKFQINAALELNKETNLPSQSQMALLKVKTAEGQLIGDAHLNIADFNYDQMKFHKLYLTQSKDNLDYPFNKDETYIQIGP